MDQEKIDAIESHQELLSVVIPVFNEELVIEESIARIRRILEVSRIVNEIIVVNDGSTDTTLDVLFGLKKSGPLRIINLSSNSGHMNAIRVGLENSKGDYIVTIDADLQDPPEAIPDMFKIISSKQEVGGGVDFLQHSCDVVQAYRIDRTTDTVWKRKSAATYYFLVKRITGINVIPHAADYRIMKKHVAQRLISLPEKNLVYRLLIPSLGFRIKSFPITRNDRFAGKSKYTNRKMISLAVDSVIGFTNRPLRFLAYSGFFASLVLLLGSIGTLLLFLFGNTLPGWPSLVLLILSFNAFLFAGVGLVGEYVGRIYQLLQARPTTSWTEM
jgi:glycosyltransferase involved in cell wall biosynthesis